MLSKLVLYIIPSLFGVYMYGVAEYFKREYAFKINDVTVILDRYLVLGLLGLVVVTFLSAAFKKVLAKRNQAVLIPVLCSVVLVISYYLFVSTAIELSSFMDTGLTIK